MVSDDSERAYVWWCNKKGIDPHLGTSARAYEEYLVGCPIEEWWDAMDEEAQEQRRMRDRGGDARL